MSEGGGKRSRDEPAAAAAAAAAESDSGTFFIDVPFYAFRPVGPARILTETGAFSIHPLFFFLAHLRRPTYLYPVHTCRSVHAVVCTVCPSIDAVDESHLGSVLLP